MHIAKVLLVDDEAAFLDVMNRRLQMRELSVRTALSGQESLNVLREDPSIDVVILDVKMPGMDGIETLRELKKEFPLIEVIMLTGHATVETAIDGMRYGAFDYLMKPCNIEQLIEKVAEAKAKKAKHEEKITDAQLKEIMGRMA